MIYILPWSISVLQGFFLLTILIPKAVRPRMALMLFWGALVGMALSAIITFTGLIFFNQLIPAYAIGMNIAVTIGLAFISKRNNLVLPFNKSLWDKADIIGIILLVLFNI